MFGQHKSNTVQYTDVQEGFSGTRPTHFVRNWCLQLVINGTLICLFSLVYTSTRCRKILIVAVPFQVLHGIVSVQSYSFIGNPPGDKQSDVFGGDSISGIFPVTKHQKLKVCASDPACCLCPGERNIHEIVCVDGPAAFLDILSPPYGTDERLGLDRDCHYYQEIESSWKPPELSATNTILLARLLSTPSDFWCDQTEYRGPRINENGDEHGS